MAESRYSAIVETLRGRLLRGLQAGTLEAGQRLPSARELVSEFDVDHRLILAAYRQMADDGLVEIRERGGVYVSAKNAAIPGLPPLPARWFIDMLSDAFTHEIPATELHEWMRRVTETLRLHAVVISTTEDQAAGIARELTHDFGLEAAGFTPVTLGDESRRPPALRRADVLVCTVAHEALANALGESLNKPVIPIDVRSDLPLGEWALLLRQPVWAIVATAEFGVMLKRYFENVKGVENLNILVFGVDDLAQIPENAPTYVTHRVRQALGDTPIRGRILPTARTIASASARSIFEFIVTANLAAMRGVRPALERKTTQSSAE